MEDPVRIARQITADGAMLVGGTDVEHRLNGLGNSGAEPIEVGAGHGKCDAASNAVVPHAVNPSEGYRI